MTDFQPEGTTPDPRLSGYGAAPLPEQQLAPPAQPYGQPLPPAQPYGQPAPPYGQPAPMATAPQYAAWGAPPPAWNPAPPRKRKVWPWVVGGIGVVVVLVVAAVLAFFAVGSAAVDGLNPDYDAPPVARTDPASDGGTLIVSDDAKVSFEAGPGWTDESAFLLGSLDGASDVPVTYMAAWTTGDLATDPSASLVVVSAAVETIPLISATLNVEHQSYITSFVQSAPTGGAGTQVGDPEPATTSSGLSGLHSVITIDSDYALITADIYTFGRGKNVVFVQVVSYNGQSDDVAARQVLDSLRIEK